MYGDLGYPILGLLLAGYVGNNLTAPQKAFNVKMSKVRISIEQAFGKWVSTFKFVQHYQNLKPRQQDIPRIHLVTMLLTNCHTCLNGHTTENMFGLAPPELEEYLSDFDPAYYSDRGQPT